MENKNLFHKNVYILTYIQQNTDKTINLMEISKKLDISYSHVVKMIKQSPDLFIIEALGRRRNVYLTNKGTIAAEYLSLALEALN